MILVMLGQLNVTGAQDDMEEKRMLTVGKALGVFVRQDSRRFAVLCTGIPGQVGKGIPEQGALKEKNPKKIKSSDGKT